MFKLSRSGTSWRETILHRFSGGADGTTPYPGVVVDAIGKVYGATTGGGIANAGTVCEISPTSTGGRKHTVLHNFAGKPDAATPYATPRLDAAGNLYGTTYAGRASNSGTVYKLTRQPGGSWTEQVIHSFSGGRDGTNPFAPVTFDRAGNIYGTTAEGGSGLDGIAFKLTLNQARGWTESILHEFLGVNFGDAGYANGLVFDTAGISMAAARAAASSIPALCLNWLRMVIAAGPRWCFIASLVGMMVRILRRPSSLGRKAGFSARHAVGRSGRGYCWGRGLRVYSVNQDNSWSLVLA